jgi:putative addiction module component (TIGR02574 family)
MADALRKKLFQLPIDERLELVQELWDSIAAERASEPLPLTDAQREELARRLHAADADPDAGSSWEEVRERILRRKS